MKRQKHILPWHSLKQYFFYYHSICLLIRKFLYGIVLFVPFFVSLEAPMKEVSHSFFPFLFFILCVFSFPSFFLFPFYFFLPNFSLPTTSSPATASAFAESPSVKISVHSREREEPAKAASSSFGTESREDRFSRFCKYTYFFVIVNFFLTVSLFFPFLFWESEGYFKITER